jgi:CubicO group peptidase (beta-lactamase class C family)
LLAVAPLQSTPLVRQSPRQTPLPVAPDDSTIQRLIRERVELRLNAGVAIGVIDSAGRRHVYAFGHAGGPASPTVDANTVFEIGSITKTFTASLLADMVQRGEVALDDPVVKYLPPEARLKSNGRDITLLDLATQSSGLPGMPGNFRPKNPDDPYADYGAPQLYQFLGGFTPSRAPGVQYEYSNLGVGLLGHALSRRAGMSYESLLDQRILTPLGMSDTRITLTSDMRRRLATGHNRDGDEVANWNLDVLAGAGAVRSTVADMLKYLAANLDSNSRPLGRTLRAAHRSQRPAMSPNMTIGLNWHVLRIDTSDIVWHNGETAGYHSFIGFDPVRRVGVVILSNSATSVDDLGFHLVDERSPLHLPPAPPVEIAQDAALLDGYVGGYSLAPAVVMSVTRSGSRLYVQLTGQQRFRLYPTSDSTYRITIVDAQLEFHRDPSGRATEVVLHQGGRDSPAKRIP